jgi:hypothetical protein
MIDTKAITQRLRLALIRAGDAMLGDAPESQRDDDTQPGKLADSDGIVEGRSQPTFQPRRVRTPNGSDWS